MRRRNSKNLGLTSEESITIDDREPDFWQTVKRDSDAELWARNLIERAKQTAIGVLTDEGLPRKTDPTEIADLVARGVLKLAEGLPPRSDAESWLIDVLSLQGNPHISANAELAARIISSVHEAPLHLQQSKELARAFIAGYELAEWTRLLLMNIEYERPARIGEKTIENGRANATARHQKEKPVKDKLRSRITSHAAMLDALDYSRTEQLNALAAKFPTVKRETIRKYTRTSRHLRASRRDSKP